MTNPKRQHWVPRMYLRGFGTEDTRDKNNCNIWVYDLEVKQAFCTSITNIAVESHLYSPVEEDGDRSFEVERQLSELEAKTAPYLIELRQRKSCFEEPDIRRTLAVFITSLLMRNRATQRIHQDIKEHLVSTAVSDSDDGTVVTEVVGKHHWPENTWRKFLALDEAGMQRLFAGSIVPTSIQIANVLWSRRWAIVESQDASFVTSDSPVIVYHPSEQQWGLGTPGVHIQVPLSPSAMLLINEYDMEEAGSYSVPAEGVQSANYLTMMQADRFVLSANRLDDRQMELLAEANKI